MAANADVFLPQRLAIPQLRVPAWPRPDPADHLSTYCQRLAAEIDPGRECFVGGASFGGIVALEVARHVNSRACFLIGSVRSPAEIPRRLKGLRPASRLLPLVPLVTIQRALAAASGLGRRNKRTHLRAITNQFAAADAKLLRWSIREFYRWRGVDPGVPVFHIHGGRDRVFPIGRVSPDETIPSGGHVISLTHARAVTEFLRRHIERDQSPHSPTA